MTLYTPHSYQKEGIKKVLTTNYTALLYPPGGGKTSTVLAAVDILLKQGLAKKVLILAPLRVCHNVWPVEAQKWDQFKHLSVVVLHGPKREELIDEPAAIVVMNYENLPWLCEGDRLKRLGADMLVFDELTRMKNPTSKRFKALRPKLDTFKRRVGLTGSPATNGLLDLFGQMYVVDGGQSLGRYITHYRNNYFYPSGFGGYEWKIKPGAEAQIYAAIAPRVHRITLGDHLDLPELVENDIYLELPAEVMKTYREMDIAMVALLEDERVFAASAAAAMSKCMQIANGGIYRNLDTAPAVDSERWQNLHDVKTDALESLVEELQGSPLLVAYNFKHDLDRIQQRFGKDTPYIGGGVSVKRSTELIEKWNRGELPLLCAHPASLSHGVNLQDSGNHVAFYGLSFDLELYEQFVRRVFRQGQKAGHVFVHHLLAKNTVDEVILKTLRKKDQTQTALLNALRDYAKERY